MPLLQGLNTRMASCCCCTRAGSPQKSLLLQEVGLALLPVALDIALSRPDRRPGWWACSFG